MFRLLRAALFLTLSVCLYGNLHAQTWKPLSDASIARWLPHGLLYGHEIYTLSGFVEYEVIVPSFEKYNILTDTWTTLTPMPNSKYETDPNQEGVTHMASILVNDTIWVFGGRAGTHPGPVTEEVWFYKISTDTWHPGPDLPIKLSGGYAINAGRTFHYVGGFFNACNGLQDSYHLTLDLDAWLADPINVSWENNRKPLPRPRSHVSVSHMAGKIVVFGGEHGHDYCYSGQPQQGIDLAEVDIYDIETDTWTVMPDLPYPRSHAEGMTFALDGKIYEVGSEVNSTISKTTLMFDPATGLWTEVTDWEFPETIMAPAVAVYRDSLYITHGGYPGRNNPKAYTKYKTITRTPVYELGWNRDTVDFWTYQGLSAEQKVFSWAKTATIKADIALEAPAPWLTTPDSVSLDIAGKRVPLSVNSTGLPSGVHYAKVILQGSSSDVVNPSLTVTYQPDTLVVRLTVGPSPDGIVLLNQPDICDGIELGSSFTFPVDLLTPGATVVNLASSSHSNTANFALSSTLPAVLAPNAETSLSMTFTPDSVGPFTSIFTVSHNGTNNSSQVMLTCEAIPACVVPTNWIETSLGTPSLTGSACVTGNTYRMTAAGKNIWSKDDEGHFLATPVSGDGEMIMKLNWLTQQDNDTKIGIMFRETLAKDSRNAFLAINPENAIALQYRKNPGESTSKVENKGFYPPQWMKLVRVGNTFTAYHSEDGVTWMVINGGNNPQTFAMSDTIYAGIAFTSHNASALSTAEVQFVSLNFAPVTFPVTLSSFDATLLGESVKIKWEAASEENFSHYEVQRKTGINPEFQAISQVAGRGMPFYTSWDHRPVSGQNVYRLVMHDIDGSIAYSDQVSVMVDVTRAFTVRHLDGDQALELMWESESTPAKISLLDITGRELYSVDKDMQIGSRNLLQLPGLSSGYYLLEVKWNGKSDRRVLSLQ